MSKYYNINGLKVRVSDHEPNHSMNKFRGASDVEFYTKSLDNRQLSVESQVEWYCEKNDLDISLFAQVLEDFSDANRPEFKVVKRKSIDEDGEEVLSCTIYFSDGDIYEAPYLSLDEFEYCDDMTESDWRTSRIERRLIK